MKTRLALSLLCSLCLFNARAKDTLLFEGKSGPGVGKQIVLISGDEEYRSEESFPQLAKILAERNGFKCTVLFSINPATGAIDPNYHNNEPGMEALDHADAVIMLLRFREWPDEQMKHFVDAYLAGKPIIALRTATHSFAYDGKSRSEYKKYNWNNGKDKEWPGGFGRQVLGETWVAHHGAHKKEATHAIIEPSAKDDPLLHGVENIFCTTDVYTANPQPDSKIILRGQVLTGMQPNDPPVDGPKNNPMQPIAWTRLYKNEAGKTNKIFCTTMGAATDLLNEDLRRLVVNAVYWGIGMHVPTHADVRLIGEYKPSMYGFDGFVKGVKVDDISSGHTGAQANPVPNPETAPAEIRTPKPKASAQINGPSIFGARSGSPFLYRIPATGDRPVQFSADGLPPGLTLDANTGEISGKPPQVISETKPAPYTVTLHAKNAKGQDTKKFKIIVGEQIALTPPMGWNSWNCWGSRVTAEKVLQSAHAMADSGLINHGWTYVNIDDAWQGKRGGEFNGIQGNEKFPDMAGLCNEIHKLGLKAGIYSTPWVTSYATHIGGSAENPEGAWEKPQGPKQPNKKILPWAIGKYSFATNDARQWGAWGIDYLKYDWNPNEAPETAEMYSALRHSGRDIVFSLSNHSPFENMPELSKYANCWRTTGDIRDNWDSMRSKGFTEDKWVGFERPGHWNDPDMLVVGQVGWGNPHPTRLTSDEQYTHITIWSLLSAPLLLGCDMAKLDDFTLNLLTNDEVLAVDQDELGEQALCVSTNGDLRVYAKNLTDGSKAVGLFNLSATGATVTANWSDLKISGKQTVRDLWRQKDLGQFTDKFEMNVAPHGAELFRIKS